MIQGFDPRTGEPVGEPVPETTVAGLDATKQDAEREIQPLRHFLHRKVRLRTRRGHGACEHRRLRQGHHNKRVGETLYPVGKSPVIRYRRLCCAVRFSSPHVLV